jgi:hypothetical protein
VSIYYIHLLIFFNFNFLLEFFVKFYKILKILLYYFLKKKIINFFKDLDMSIFVNSVKFLPTPKSLRFFFPKKIMGILRILTGFNENSN